MTNLDTTPRDAHQAGAHRRRFGPFLKVTFAAIMALLGVGFFATPALAHNATVTGAASCATAAGSYTVTWTITNDFNETETATVNSVTGGLTTLSATTVTISPGSTSALTQATITQTLPATTTGTVTIKVGSTWPQPSPFSQNNSASVTLPTGCFPPSVSVLKSVSPGTVPAGSTTPVVYTLAIKNNSALATSSAVNVSDIIPAGLTYVAGSVHCVTGGTPTCTPGESNGTVTYTLAAGLAAGATYDVSFSVTANFTDPAETIMNTATFTGNGCTTSPNCQSNQVPVAVTVTSLTVGKSANVTSVTAGQNAPVIYTLTVSNPINQLTPFTTQSPVTVSDVVPSGLTYASSSCGALSGTSSPSCTATYDSSTRTVSFVLGAGIVVGASIPLTFQATVNASDTTSILNSGSWTGPGCVASSGSATCTTNVVTITVASFTVSKSDSAGSNSVNPGDVVNYTLSAKNIGTGPGSITVTDSAPTGTTLTTPAAACPANTASTCSVTVTGSSISWVITNLPAGASYNLTFAVKVNPGTGGTHILNTGVFTEPGCTTAGGCSTNTTDNPVPPPTSAGTPTTTTTVPTTSVKTANGVAIKGASSVHTGEPWAGSSPYVLAVLAFGLSLLGLGAVRRRRATKAPTA